MMGKRARYRAERAAIGARYAESESCGPPEMRAGAGAAFSPRRRSYGMDRGTGPDARLQSRAQTDP